MFLDIVNFHARVILFPILYETVSKTVSLDVRVVSRYVRDILSWLLLNCFNGEILRVFYIMVHNSYIQVMKEVFRVVQTYMIMDLGCLRRVILWKTLWQTLSLIH